MAGRDFRMKRAGGRAASPGREHEDKFLDAFAAQDGHPVAAPDARTRHSGVRPVDQFLKCREIERDVLVDRMNGKLVRMPGGEIGESGAERPERNFERLRIDGGRHGVSGWFQQAFRISAVDFRTHC